MYVQISRRIIGSASVALLAGVVLIAQKSQLTEKDVLPIFEKRCFQCHGAALKMANLDLRTRESLLKGGDKGPAIVPGKSASSLLIHRVTGTVGPKMPMPPMPALTEKEIASLK